MVGILKLFWSSVLATRYKTAALGEAKCSNGYCPIRSLAECNAARNSLAISGWNADSLQTHHNRLPHCFVGGGGYANFNPNCDSGSDPGKSKIICERCGKIYITFT